MKKIVLAVLICTALSGCVDPIVCPCVVIGVTQTENDRYTTEINEIGREGVIIRTGQKIITPVKHQIGDTIQ